MFQPQTPWLLKRMVDIGREMHKEMKWCQQINTRREIHIQKDW
ncbi:hypothetical protein MYOV057v1_p0204 [Vibrio phage 184E37.1]|nr:hypothetical protein MYOV057v1_p0204 [Vibrio phage 184E37.1]